MEERYTEKIHQSEKIEGKTTSKIEVSATTNESNSNNTDADHEKEEDHRIKLIWNLRKLYP